MRPSANYWPSDIGHRYGPPSSPPPKAGCGSTDVIDG